MIKSRKLAIINVRLLDIDSDRWIAVKKRNYRSAVSGVYYDEANDMIYDGRYSSILKQVLDVAEYYDIYKTVWNIILMYK